MQRFFASIDYIEQHLWQKISVHQIAAASHYSTYHYSRMFKALVGDTPKEYLRKRRLTVAAQRLLTEEVGILQLALECQFDSQEAFTRAFKALFNITPAQYRKINEPFRLLYKKPLNAENLDFLQQRLSMEPEIIDRPALKLVGIPRQYDDGDLDLVTLWQAFAPHRELIQNRIDGHFVGLYESYSETEHSTEFCYICSAPVSEFGELTPGMVRRELAAQRYARFTHRGPISELEQTLSYIWGSWLPKSDYQYAERPDFELYPAGYNPGAADSECYLHIPITAKDT